MDILELKWVVVQEQISGTFMHEETGGSPLWMAFSLKIDKDQTVIWGFSWAEFGLLGGVHETTSGHVTCSGRELLISLQIQGATQQFKAQVKDSGNVIEMENTPELGR